MPSPSRPLMSEREFRLLAERLRRNERPRVNHPSAITQATSLVEHGIVVSAGETPALPAAKYAAEDGHAHPYRLLQWYAEGDDWAAVNDRLEIDVHGAMSMTHIDTIDHFFWNSRNFHGQQQTDLAVEPPPADALKDLRDGIISRGVLIDVPGMLGFPIPPGHVITLDDLLEALELQRVTLHPGDALYISFGRSTPRRSDVPLGSEPTAGLSIECVEWIAEKEPAVIISDRGLDVDPSEVAGVLIPWHLMLLTVLGIPLVDMAMLARLSRTCSRLGRWEFLSTIAPLHIPGASGSPVNPIAMF